MYACSHDEQGGLYPYCENQDTRVRGSGARARL